jgi:glycine/D-amino acid oxidase-like deaminating enzyme
MPATLPQLPFVLCREAYLTPAANGVACAGATYDLDADPRLRAASQQENLERLRALVSDPEAGAGCAAGGRVGFRCVAPDRLPLVGALPDFDAAGSTERLRDVPRHPGLYGLLGYASRGLIWAPLCAELLAARWKTNRCRWKRTWSTPSIRPASCCAHAAAARARRNLRRNSLNKRFAGTARVCRPMAYN